MTNQLFADIKKIQDLLEEARDRNEWLRLLAVGPEIDRVIESHEKFRKLDREAATFVETQICMRTDFTGDPPYVGWKGIGLALTETLDERDRLRKENVELRRQKEDFEFVAKIRLEELAKYWKREREVGWKTVKDSWKGQVDRQSGAFDPSESTDDWK